MSTGFAPIGAQGDVYNPTQIWPRAVEQADNHGNLRDVERAEAHRTLDRVRLGLAVSDELVRRALWSTGDAVGLDLEEVLR